MSLFVAEDSGDRGLTAAQIKSGLFHALDAIGPRRRVIAVPPDFTRVHSRAGALTAWAHEYYGPSLACVLPALGTHQPMTDSQIEGMFPGVRPEIFAVHDWRDGVETLGEIPEALVCRESEGKLTRPWPVQINRLLVAGGFDLILSIGQVVPHEVAGMAGHNKNIFIGAGGAGNIHNTHFLGAVYGMERIMGRADNPVRRILNYAASRWGRGLPVVHVLTVVGRLPGHGLATRGLFIGDDLECFERAAELSLQVNFEMLPRPLEKVVVYLNPEEFHSSWLGNKAIYRTRMAIADGGELIILAPGVRRFGEDAAIDALIRKFGYSGTAATLAAIERSPELASNLSAAAHLIHGSSEGRFAITYCPGHISKEDIEAVNFGYAALETMLPRYNPSQLQNGYNRRGGEEFFFISNPGLGLWAHADRFRNPTGPVAPAT